VKNQVGTVFVVFCRRSPCGATFHFALHRQLALVEVAASLAIGAELYFLSSSIRDLIEKRKESNKYRLTLAVGLAAAVVCYFLISKSLNPVKVK
jgi:NhaP-type Na+/H+ or K+/H+ antiporter